MEPVLKIVNKPICLQEILSTEICPAHGADIIFNGVVRNHNLGRKVVSVTYDTFEPLALKVFGQICEEAQATWGAGLSDNTKSNPKRFGITLIHRVGLLLVGEISLYVRVSSPHREEVYRASRYIVDNIKHRVPIWKKEVYEDGETEWVDGHSLCN